MIGAAKDKSSLPGSLTALRVLLCLLITFLLAGTRAEAFFAPPDQAPGQIAAFQPDSTGKTTTAWQYDALDSLIAANSGDDLVRLYHGTTSNAGSKIVGGGFRQSDTFFAEEMATSRYFAGEAAARTGARSTTSIEFTMPRSVAEDLGLMQRRIIGADRNLPTPDIDFGTGFERILPSGNVGGFNSLMEQGIITTRRRRH
jgi:hypothetical protein